MLQIVESSDDDDDDYEVEEEEPPTNAAAGAAANDERHQAEPAPAPAPAVIQTAAAASAAARLGGLLAPVPRAPVKHSLHDEDDAVVAGPSASGAGSSEDVTQEDAPVMDAEVVVVAAEVPPLTAQPQQKRARHAKAPLRPGEHITHAEGLALHMSGHTNTGYVGVRRNMSHRGGRLTFTSICKGKAIGTYESAVAAAVAYAQHVQQAAHEAAALAVNEATSRVMSRVPNVSDLLEVEVAESEENGGEVTWKVAEVKEVTSATQRFTVMINGDSEFIEEYGMEDEGTEWRKPPLADLPRLKKDWAAAVAVAVAAATCHAPAPSLPPTQQHQHQHELSTLQIAAESLRQQEETLRQDQQLLKQKEDELERRKKEMEEAIERRERAMAARESALSKRETALGQRCADIRRRETALAQRESALTARVEEFELFGSESRAKVEAGAEEGGGGAGGSG